MKHDRLIVFVKSPEGKVKSRLAESIGEGPARGLYRCFVPDLLDALDGGDYDLTIFHHPPEAGETVRQWLGRGRSYAPQAGADLGERMKRAFEECFAAGCTAAVLIGTDFPDLPAEMIETAFTALEANDAVLGPALDGGYYLIGFRADTFFPEVFAGLPWGTDAVFDRTRDILEGHGLKVSVHPLWRDIDTVEDLRALIEKHKDGPFAASRTLRYALSHPCLTGRYP